jgi:hypothetical protein
MKYFMDCEFLEGPQKEKFPISLFRKETPNTIDLISIGIVAEDGRELYLISKDFNLEEAWNRFDLKKILPVISTDLTGSPNGLYTHKQVFFIRENVLKPIWRDLFFKADDCSGLSNKQTEKFLQDINSGRYDHYFSFKSFKFLIEKYGKTNKEIANIISTFCHCELHLARRIGGLDFTKAEATPKFYAYYADYDWVVFCWLFGKMIDLPSGFPMYCINLKQILDEKAKKYIKPYCLGDTEKQVENMAERSVKGQVESFKTFSGYPKQDPSKSHNAIEDARWNKKLFDFLNKL